VAPPSVDGATPLDPDDAEGLIPSHIESRAELNEWEQANIAKAVFWMAERRVRGPVLALDFLRELHHRMFGDTWRWAGQFRNTAKNLGISPAAIPESLGNLLEDTKYWIKNATFTVDEIAARFHHRLVQIHAFPNGNGRHGRLMTDALLEECGVAPFTWGSADLDALGTARTSYLSALRRADAGDFAELLALVRT
jgi:Fic-DOC domain mobile mystery protein B